MKDGLPLKLFEFIKAQGYITYQQMVDKTNDLGYKVETATRKLRLLTDETDENPHPLVKKVKNDKGVIIGYRYVGTSTGILTPKPTETPLTAKPVALFDTPRPKFKSHYE